MRYSNDLRNKVLDLIINKSYKQNAIAKLLNINKSTIFRWYKQYKSTNNIEYKRNYKTGRPSKIIDLIKFKDFIDNNTNLNLNNIAKQYSNIIKTKLTKSTVHRVIVNKLNYTFKKSLGYTEKEMID